MSTATDLKTTSKPKASVVDVFTMQADHFRNSDLLIQSISNCRLRSTIKAGRGCKSISTGENTIPIGQSTFLGRLPTIEGMSITVNPTKCTYVITDPLIDSPDFCERLQKSMNQIEGYRSGKIRGVPAQKGTLDVHRMKTLCRELMWIVDSNDGVITKGIKPALADIENMPGEFLLNPGCRVDNTQPRYEKDWDKWVAQLTRSGG